MPDYKDRKPPIGVKPQWIWREHRVLALLEAMHRYIGDARASEETVQQWHDEIGDHLWWLRDYVEQRDAPKEEREIYGAARPGTIPREEITAAVHAMTNEETQ